MTSRYLSVTTNDPARRLLRLEIRVHVVGSVTLIPVERLELSNLEPDKRVARLLIRKDETERGYLQIDDVRTPIPWLRARVEAIEQPRSVPGVPPARAGDWLLEVALGQDPSPGVGLHTVSFATGLPRQPRIEVPVRVRVRPVVNLSPERLVLRGRPGAGRGPSETVLAVVRKDLTASALRVDAEPESIEVRLEAVGPRHFKADVAWNPPADAPAAEGALFFRIGDERVRLPVTLLSGG